MLDIPQEIKDLFWANNTNEKTLKKFRLRFFEEGPDSLYPYETLFPDESLFPSEREIPWVTIENNRIESESLKIIESLSESENLEFGSCNAAQMEIVVADVVEDLTGREFALTVEIGGYEMALGIYTVKSYIRQSDRRKRKITAYDRMDWFNVDVADWYNSLKFPMTLKTFRDSFCAYIGIEQGQDSLVLDTMQISKTIEPKELPGIDVLKAICQINGRFGYIDKTGILRYVGLQQTGLYPSESLYPEEELFPSEFGGDGKPVENIFQYRQPMVYEDYMVEGITGLTIREQEGDIGANIGEGDNPYTIEGNFLVYGKSSYELLEIANALLPVIGGKTYRPVQVSCNALPWIEVGDALRIHTRNDIVETFVMKRTISGCQAMKDEFQSTGTQKRESVFGINKQIIQLEGKSAVIIKNVEEVSATVTDLKNYTEAQFKITAEQITAEVTRAKGEEEKLSGRINVTAEQITAEVTRATKAEGQLSSKITQTATEIRTEVTNVNKNLQSQITQQAEHISLKVSKGDVTGQLNSELKITGNAINLTTGHFTINAKNFSVDNNGNAVFSGDITGVDITGSSFSGGSINIGDGFFEVESDGSVTMGDYFISADGSNIFRSNDNNFRIEMVLNRGDGEHYPSITMQSTQGEMRIENGQIIGAYSIEADSVNADIANRISYFYDIELGKSWWDGWTITETVQDLWEQVDGLSDQKVKENIIPISDEEALEFLLASNPVTFQYKTDGKWSTGFIAQEVDKIQSRLDIYFPLVGTDKRTGYYNIKYTNYIPIIISAIQNIQRQINNMKGEAQ